MTGIPCFVADNPLACVAVGTGMALENLEVLKDALEGELLIGSRNQVLRVGLDRRIRIMLTYRCPTSNIGGNKMANVVFDNVNKRYGNVQS